MPGWFKMKCLLLFALIIVHVSGAQNIPQRLNSQRLVNDYTGTLNVNQINKLEKKLGLINDISSNQIAVVLINSLEGADISDFAFKIGRDWHIGGNDFNKGVVFLISIGDKKMKISTGYGLNGALTDITTKHIIEDEIKPNYKVNDYYRSIDDVTDAIILIIGFWGCNGYNGLVGADQGVKKVWSNVETNYQRRTDLYNSVIKTIEGSANFEKSTLKEVMEARSKATQIQVDINDPASLEAYQKAQANLQGSFSRLMAFAENYPNFKTTDAFRDFKAQIEGTENRINIARQDYNKAIEDYNLRVKKFPGVILARLFGYNEKPFYKADEGTEKAPQIDFNIN